MKIKEYFQNLVKAGVIPQEPANYDVTTLKIYIDHLESKNATLRKKASAAERAFSKLVHEMYENDIRPMCDEKFFIESRLKDAEKEIAEEEK